MGLFQKPATRRQEVEPLALPPEEVATLDEETWYQRVFRGDAVPQLTLRALVTGSVLGFVLSFTNVYIGLKAGFTANVAITACIVSFAIWTGLRKAGVAGTPLSILESNCMQSTASAAGYSTGTMLNAAIPALLLLTVSAELPGGRHPSALVVGAFIFFMALLGTVMAIPMKRTMINHERLHFPSGTAAAVTLQSLYSHGAEALGKARVMMYAALAAGITPLVMDLRLRGGGSLLPASSRIFDGLPARGVDPGTGARLVPSDWTVVLDHKLLMIGIGAIVGLRVCASLILGALLLALVIGPAAMSAGAVKTPSLAWLEIGLWLGAPMMVVSGLLALALKWRTVARSLRSLGSTGPKRPAEVPFWVFLVGVLVAGTGVVTIASACFQVAWFWGIVAVALTFVLAAVACRVAGETDITPIGGMGAIAQFTFGVLLPHNPTANLGTAAIAGSAAASSADLLTDLKSGYLLGASPRRQFVAQVMGILPGTVAAVLCYFLLVPDARALTGTGGVAPAFPAPAAQMWAAMARLLTGGLENLHPFARRAIAVGAAVGILLTLAEQLPARYRRFVPSATGLGLGMTMPFQFPLSMFIGAVLGEAWSRRRRAQAERFLVPLASGLIAGESIIGVLVVTANNLFW